MGIIKRIINLTLNEIQNIEMFITNTKDKLELIEKSIKLNNEATIEFSICGNESSRYINLYIYLNLFNGTRRYLIKAFQNICYSYSLMTVGFKYGDTIYMFRFNTNYTECYDLRYQECATEDVSYFHIIASFINYDIENIEHFCKFICENISEKSLKESSSKIISKLEYFGFEELYDERVYATLKRDYKNKTKNIASFLIYCLNCISNNQNNIYDNYKIFEIANELV